MIYHHQSEMYVTGSGSNNESFYLSDFSVGITNDSFVSCEAFVEVDVLVALYPSLTKTPQCLHVLDLLMSLREYPRDQLPDDSSTETRAPIVYYIRSIWHSPNPFTMTESIKIVKSYHVYNDGNLCAQWTQKTCSKAYVVINSVSKFKQMRSDHYRFSKLTFSLRNLFPGWPLNSTVLCHRSFNIGDFVVL